MKKVFTHENRLIVFNIKNLLLAQGISCQLKNEFASGGVGDLAPFETWPEIWVDDKDVSNAEQIIRQSENDEAMGTEWSCPKCGKKNAANFEICWNCNEEPLS